MKWLDGMMLLLVLCLGVLVGYDKSPFGSIELSKAQLQSLPSVSHMNQDLEVCNNSQQHLVYASVAYFDEQMASWVEKGWLKIPKGQCITALKGMMPPFYGYAESFDGRLEWGLASSEQYEEPAFPFCIHPEDRFVYKRSNCDALMQESSMIQWRLFTQLGGADQKEPFKWIISQ